MLERNALYVLTRLCDSYIEYIARTKKLCKDNYNNTYRLKDGTMCYGFIPKKNTKYIIETLATLHGHLFRRLRRDPKFLDIGCGIGNIVMIAKCLQYEAAGLEYDSKICKIAKELCSSSFSYIFAKIIKGDMRKFEDYDKYDVLYYYQPMLNAAEMHKFTVKLSEEMKPGAYLFCWGPSTWYKKSKEFRKLTKYGTGQLCLWRKRGNLR